MHNDLEKIDILRNRMGISYREATEALEEADGDLVRALIMVEENKDHRWGDEPNDKCRRWGNELKDKGSEVVDQIKTYIEKGNRTKVKLKREDKTIVEFPATVGAVGILAALASPGLAVVAGVGAVAAIAKNVSVEIEKADGETKVISLDRHRKE